MNTLLEGKKVTKHFGGLPAVDGVDFHLQNGEICGFIGPNGAGKTTLVNLITGVFPLTGGEIWFRGQNITNLPAHVIGRMGVSRTYQVAKPFSGMSVRENLMMGAFSRVDKAEVLRDLEWVFHLFPVLTDRKTQLGGTLSGGEQQMCAIGRGLMSRPKLLLIDELSLGLAPVIVDDLVKTLEVIKQRGTAIFLVEQDVQLALEHAQRGYVLETGKIVLSGSAQELLHNPHVKTAYLGV
jgi:branched-chain amino acid transport system ATP-binding protein